MRIASASSKRCWRRNSPDSFRGNATIATALRATRRNPPARLPARSEPMDRRESNRQKSRLRARIEHVFGYLGPSMKGFYLRFHWAAAQRGGQRVDQPDLQPGPLRTDGAAEVIDAGRLKSEDQNQKQPKPNHPKRIKRQKNTNGSTPHETSHTENRTATI